MKKLLPYLAIISIPFLTSCDDRRHNGGYSNDNPSIVDTEVEARAAVLDYVGLSLLEAEQLANIRGEDLRVVFANGEQLLITTEFQRGRINVWVDNDTLTFIDVEGFDFNFTGNRTVITSDDVQELIQQYVGLTEGQARFLAWQQEVEFRIISRDGIAISTSNNLVHGRIGATVGTGVVSAIEVEVDSRFNGNP